MSRRNRLQNYIQQQFEVSIDALSTRGWGQGHIIDERGKQIGIEVRGALPGDTVLVQGRHIEDSMVQSTILEFKTQSYPRISSDCPHSAVRTDKDTGCGGCTLRECTYQTQCKLKEDIIRHAFDTQNLKLEIQPIIPCESQHFYRNKVELSFGPDGVAELGLGLHPSGFRYEVISMKTCDMISPLLPEIAQATQAWARKNKIPYFAFRENRGFLRLLTLREGKRTGTAMVILTTSQEDPVTLTDGQAIPANSIIESFSLEVLNNLSRPIQTFYWSVIHAQRGEPTFIKDTLVFGDSVLHEKMLMPDEEHALHYEILPRAFFQPNTIQAERLYQVILQQAEPFISAETPVLDLYCGTGTIALSFAKYGHHAIAIDIERQAIENAIENARKNGLDHLIDFYAGDVADILRQLLDDHHDFNDFLLIVDPPRRGLLPPAYRQIMRIRPKVIIYVSCNPESLAEDLSKFITDGYQILNVQPIDMLPQTAHLETVVTLEIRQ